MHMWRYLFTLMRLSITHLKVQQRWLHRAFCNESHDLERAVQATWKKVAALETREFGVASHVAVIILVSSLATRTTSHDQHQQGSRRKMTQKTMKQNQTVPRTACHTNCLNESGRDSGNTIPAFVFLSLRIDLVIAAPKHFIHFENFSLQSLVFEITKLRATSNTQ